MRSPHPFTVTIDDPQSAPVPPASVQHIAPLRLRVRLHLRLGWWALLAFACVGLGLEALHGFKVGYYLDVPNTTRRLMWRLAHAHGVLLALVNIAFGATLQLLPPADWASRWASRGLIAATTLMPLGFLLGGFDAQGGDPGLGVALVPVGGLSLIGALSCMAIGLGRRS